MSSNSEFTRDSKLIERVKQQPILYDLNHPRYKNNSARKMAWERLAPAAGFSSKKVQAKWRSLKNKYRDALNAKEVRSGGSPKPISKKQKFLITEMDFFRSFLVDDRPTMSNFEVENTSSNSVISDLFDQNTSSTYQELLDSTAESLDENDCGSDYTLATATPSPTPSSSLKRKRTNDANILNELLDTMKGHTRLIASSSQKPPCRCQNIDSFFISLADECRSVDPKYSLELKIALMIITKFYVDKTNDNK